MTRRRGRPPAYYSIYLRETDDMICWGTSSECAAKLGMPLSGFYSMVSRVRRGINRKYDVYTEPLEEGI